LKCQCWLWELRSLMLELVSMKCSVE
jgi:hypothetical protein